MFKKLYEFLQKENISFKEDYKMSYHSYCKVGGEAKFYITPDSQSKLISLISHLKYENIEYKLIGETSNLIFLDEIVYGIIISTKLLDQIQIDAYKAIVEPGVNLSSFLRILYSKKIEGYSGLEGIPGSIGGAIVMNAGAYGYTISDKLISVKVLDQNGIVQLISRNDCLFSPRNSFFRENKKVIILEIIFDISVRSEISDVEYYKEIETYHIARHSYQEFVLPNAGSIFTTDRCIYDDFSDINIKFKICYKLTNKLFHNKLMRLKNRKSPNRLLANRIISKIFNLDEFEKIYSIKHINMFAIKDGNSYELINYIYKLKSILAGKIRIENEIIIDSVINWRNVNENDVKEKLIYIETGKRCD
ncbi:FAD-binding protein [Pectobacterium carotovorum]|uniref:FAD-binding protein n=1 Tax=Pectobacterium carotovorum TaxID=554 RepID=UPI0032EBC310